MNCISFSSLHGFSSQTVGNPYLISLHFVEQGSALQSARAALGEAMGRCRVHDFPKEGCVLLKDCFHGAVLLLWGEFPKKEPFPGAFPLSKIISLGMGHFLVYSISPRNEFPCGRAFSFSVFLRGKISPFLKTLSLA